MFWIAQALAVIICIISALSYFSKRKETYLADQLLVNILYGVQYILLGAFSGAVSNAVSLVKYVVFYVNAKNSKKNPTWQVIMFCMLSVVLGVLAYSNLFSIIPIITSVVFTIAIWQDNPVVLRGIVIFCNLLWVIYNIAVGAYISAVYSIVELLAALVTMISLIRRRHEL